MLSYIRLPILAGVSSVLFHELIVREKVVFLLTQKGGKASEGNHNFCDFWAKERRLFLRSRKVERNIHIWRLWEIFDILAWNVHYYIYFLCVIQCFQCGLLICLKLFDILTGGPTVGGTIIFRLFLILLDIHPSSLLLCGPKLLGFRLELFSLLYPFTESRFLTPPQTRYDLAHNGM